MAYVLLAEGGDDAWVFKTLCDHYGIAADIRLNDRILANTPTISVKRMQGVDEHLESLRVWLKDENVERLGIIVDADARIETRWQNLRQILIDAQYGVERIPNLLDRNGAIIVQERCIVPVVGIWIMPDNANPGALEDFIKLLMPRDDILWVRANECVDQLPEQRFAAHHKTKAYVRTWLAWQKEPGASMGLAIAMGVLLPDAPPVAPLLDWIRRLFGLDTAPAS